MPQPFTSLADGVGLCVRANRYALALVSERPPSTDTMALHDNPLCVKASGGDDTGSCMRSRVLSATT